MKKKNKKLKISGFEKVMFAFTFVLLVLSPILSVYAKSNLSKANYELESFKDDIALQEKSNQSLQMKINELASFDNLESIAQRQGLSYTSNSIKTVE